MTLIIRKATLGDLPGVHQMMILLARHHGDKATVTPERLREQLFDNPIGHLVVAGEEEGLVGYALLLPRPNMVTGGTGQEIHHLFVMEWRRKAGVGQALIAALRQASKGAKYPRIVPHSDNFGTQYVYRRTGHAQLPSPEPRFRAELV
ncbi:MAG: GNAT family N-acetyltransferase [Candidatus Saccharibacteria bacterium]|nr:GNAT family N-acetyltransferase [Pseudorhodobacter sp.]